MELSPPHGNQREIDERVKRIIKETQSPNSTGQWGIKRILALKETVKTENINGEQSEKQ